MPSNHQCSRSGNQDRQIVGSYEYTAPVGNNNACLCGIPPRTWCIVISILDLVRSLLCISYGLYWIFVKSLIIQELSFLPAGITELEGSSESKDGEVKSIPFWKRSESRRDVLFPTLIVWSAISFLFSISLIHGAKKRSSSILRLWFVYKFFATLASIPLYVWLWVTTDQRIRVTAFVLYVLSYAAVLFSLFVVYLFIQEIFSAREQERRLQGRGELVEI